MPSVQLRWRMFFILSCLAILIGTMAAARLRATGGDVHAAGYLGPVAVVVAPPPRPPGREALRNLGETGLAFLWPVLSSPPGCMSRL